jgi:hypothetical protein
MQPNRLLHKTVVALSAGLAVALIGGVVTPADAGNHATRSMRQEYLKECTAQAQTQKLDGAAQRQFVDDCVKSRSQTSAEGAQQMKTTMCQRRATQNKLQGHDRQHFVEDCANAPTEMSEHHEKVLRCSVRATQEKKWGDARKKYLNDCIGS